MTIRGTIRIFAAAGSLSVAALLGTAGTAMAATPASGASQVRASTPAGMTPEGPALGIIKELQNGTIAKEVLYNPIIHGG